MTGYHVGDCLELLRQLPDQSVNCCVTSPPYWGLRDYGKAGQLGLEKTPEEYVARMVEVFREVRRALRDDGSLWLNLGDSYAGSTMTGGNAGINASGGPDGLKQRRQFSRKTETPGLKPKDLVGIPWMVAFALRADGWYLRSDIIWHKPNPMPESVRDRPTKAHEYLFLLTKRPLYYYDADSVKEPAVNPGAPSKRKTAGMLEQAADPKRFATRPVGRNCGSPEFRNRRTVWTVTPKPFKGAHFAVMPEDLAAPCILAGCPKNGIVLDPFGGAGTTAVVAERLGRRWCLFDLNEDYAALAHARIVTAAVKRWESTQDAAVMVGDDVSRHPGSGRLLRATPVKRPKVAR